MSSVNDTGLKTFLTDIVIPSHSRVKLVGGLLVLALLADTDWIGTTRNDVPVAVAGTPIAVNLRTKPGTVKMIALAAIAAGAEVFTAAAGKVSVSASGAFPVGRALEAASNDLDWIEVMVAAGETVVP